MKKDYETFRKKVKIGDCRYLHLLKKRFPAKYEELANRFIQEDDAEIMERSSDALYVYEFIRNFPQKLSATRIDINKKEKILEKR